MLLFWWYIRVKDFDFDKVLIVEKSHENILVYNTLYKRSIDSKPLRIKFDEIGRFIRV